MFHHGGFYSTSETIEKPYLIWNFQSDAKWHQIFESISYVCIKVGVQIHPCNMLIDTWQPTYCYLYSRLTKSTLEEAWKSRHCRFWDIWRSHLSFWMEAYKYEYMWICFMQIRLMTKLLKWNEDCATVFLRWTDFNFC